MKVLLLLPFIFIYSIANAQLPVEWQKHDNIDGSCYLSAGGNGISAIVAGSLMRWDTAGNLIFEKPFSPDNIQCDAEGNTYMVSGNVITKLNQQGQKIWSEYPFFSDGFYTVKMLITPYNELVVGWTNNVSAAINYVPDSSSEIIACYQADGTKKWVDGFNGLGYELTDLTCDAEDNIYVGGTIPPSLLWLNGGAGIIKIDAGGTPLWDSLVSPNIQGTYSMSVQADKNGNVYSAANIGGIPAMSAFDNGGKLLWSITDTAGGTVSEVAVSQSSIYSILTGEEDTIVYDYYDSIDNRPVYNSYPVRLYLKVHQFSKSGAFIREYKYMIADSNYDYNYISGLEIHSLRVYDDRLAFYGIIGDTSMVFLFDTSLNLKGISKTFGVDISGPVLSRSYISMGPLGFYAYFGGENSFYTVYKFNAGLPPVPPVSNEVSMYYSEGQFTLLCDSSFTGTLNIYSGDGRLVQSINVSLWPGLKYEVPMKGLYATGIYIAWLTNEYSSAKASLKFMYE